MARRKLLIVGNSHTQMVSKALDKRSGEPDQSLEVEVCWLISKGKGDFGETSRDDALGKISALDTSGLLAVSLLGTLHNLLGLFEHSTPFTVMHSSDECEVVQPNTDIVPLSLMRDLFKQVTEDDFQVKKFSKLAPCPVIHFFPPPPKEHFRKPGKIKMIDGKAVEFRFADARSRLNLWKLETAIVEQYLLHVGVSHYLHPLRAIDDRGFLRPEYHAQDATHANAAYGALLLEDFERMLGTSGSGYRQAQ